MTEIEYESLVSQLVEELVQFHHQKMVQGAQRILPHVTPEDLLQPNDFEELEYHPQFRYEEGVLAGIKTV